MLVENFTFEKSNVRIYFTVDRNARSFTFFAHLKSTFLALFLLKKKYGIVNFAFLARYF